MKILSVLVLITTFFACTAPQQPYRFSLSTDKTQAMPNLRAALAENGHETEYIDEEAGIIRTRWMDTGFLFGEVQGLDATVVRRYTVILVAQADGSVGLTLRADTKRCAQDGFEVAGEMITGACEVMTELVGPHQDELTQLGIQLQQRLGYGA